MPAATVPVLRVYQLVDTKRSHLLLRQIGKDRIHEPVKKFNFIPTILSANSI